MIGCQDNHLITQTGNTTFGLKLKSMGSHSNLKEPVSGGNRLTMTSSLVGP
jgi:hypothetical protein